MISPAMIQDLGLLSDAVKAAPSAVSTILVIVVVYYFLKHERARDKDFREMLTEQRKDSIDALEKQGDRQFDVMEKLSENMERIAEGQTRILEAVHGCSRRPV